MVSNILTLDHIVLDEDDVVDLAMLRQVDEIDLTDWKWQKPEIMRRLLGALPGCRFSEYPIYYDQSYDGDDRYPYSHRRAIKINRIFQASTV